MKKSRKLVPLAGSERRLRPGAVEAGKPDPGERIRITLLLRPRKPMANLESSQALRAVRPTERRYLTREQLAAQYGADPDDIATVETFAHNHNLTVAEASVAKRSVILDGTIQDLSAAFGVTLANYEHSEGNFRGRTGPIRLPPELVDIVQGVFGFDNRPQGRPRVVGFHPVTAARAAGSAGYTPLQVASLYNFPKDVAGTGQCIGILEFGGGYTAAELQTYFQGLGVTPPQITAVSVDGVQNKPVPGLNSSDIEVALDIEMAGGIAPGAQIVVYFAPWTEQGWVDAIQTAVHDNLHKPNVLSISWGFAEGADIWTPQAVQAVNDAFQAAAAIGMTICVASGDDGSRDEVRDGKAHVDFPASSPWVLACGGTTLQSSDNVITSETVWNTGSLHGLHGGASGGGVSDEVPLPPWQVGAKVPPSVNPGSNIGRGVPDVAGNADPATGFLVLSDGQRGIVGGTSAVAPLWAGLIARINEKLGKPAGFINPVLYSSKVAKTAAFSDITSGNNDITGEIGGYPAGPGWDACTGWGSPNGAELLIALSGGDVPAGTPAPSKPGASTSTGSFPFPLLMHHAMFANFLRLRRW